MGEQYEATYISIVTIVTHRVWDDSPSHVTSTTPQDLPLCSTNSLSVAYLHVYGKIVRFMCLTKEHNT